MVFSSNKTNKYWIQTENAMPSMASLDTLIATNSKGKVNGKLKIAVKVKLPPALIEIPAISVKIDENPKEVRKRTREKVPRL